MRNIFVVGGLIALALVLRMMMTSDPGTTTALADAFRPLLNAYLNAFNSPTTAVAVCIAMIVVGLGLLVYYAFWSIQPRTRALRRLAQDLQAAGQLAPAARTPAVDRLMTSTQSTARIWALYRATLQEGADGTTRASVRPDTYFNMKMLEAEGLRLRFFMGLPGDFVGLGLIFTFLGLVAGLYFATQSMMSSDLAEARASLVSLLHSATFKFLSSITGIGLSLLLSWTQRILLDRLQAQLDEIQIALEFLFPVAGAPPQARTA